MQGDDMRALIERVERGTGPDPALDGEIVAVMRQHENPWQHKGDGWITAWGVTVMAAEVTRSLDAALTLVPEGWTWAHYHNGTAECGSRDHLITKAQAATPALALTAAALRARLAMMEDTRDA